MRTAAGSMAGLLPLLAACNSVFGIDPASLEDSGGGAAAASDASAGSVASYSLDCDAYCNVIGTNCTTSPLGTDTEYLSPEVCARICPLYESIATPGGIVDPAQEPTPGDTLNCRVWHANAAAHSPHTHCPHAGPLGGDLCDDTQLGGHCNAFCRLNVAICIGDAAAYASYGDCMNACLPDAGGYAGFPYNLSPGDPEVLDLATSGSTLNCRMYHLENFLLSDAAVHCSHTTPSGGGVCVN